MHLQPFARRTKWLDDPSPSLASAEAGAEKQLGRFQSSRQRNGAMQIFSRLVSSSESWKPSRWQARRSAQGSALIWLGLAEKIWVSY